MPAIEENYDVVVVGAGHAGCEAALACARLGLETIIFTVSVDSIAMMPCNPNIGGSSKGHLVREIDALGGQMGINIDKTFIQSKMLNKSKGPAVHSLRAQADKVNYSMEMRKTLQNTEHLTIRQAEVAEIITVPANSADGETAAVEKKDGQMVEINGELQKITGVKTVSGGVYHCKAVVLCTGTYLRARCLTGEMITYTGPNGLMAANHLTDSLKAHGIEMFRFKTGTPARVDKRSLSVVYPADKREPCFCIGSLLQRISLINRIFQNVLYHPVLPFFCTPDCRNAFLVQCLCYHIHSHAV